MVICPYNGFQQNGTFGTFGTYFFWLALKKKTMVNFEIKWTLYKLYTWHNTVTLTLISILL